MRAQHRRVYNICYRFTGSATDAEDLTQDVFLKVYRVIGSYDVEKGAFTTWLTTLTRNQLVDDFRKKRQERLTDSMDASLGADEDGPSLADRIESEGTPPDEVIAQKQVQKAVQQALLKLSPDLREAVILRDIQDMDYREIATALKVPEGTVKSRINRGRTELARILSRTNRQVTNAGRS